MSPYNEIKNKMWVTKGSRFNAVKRIKRKHSISVWFIAMMSCYVLMINSITMFFPNANNWMNSTNIPFVTFTLSLFILIITLLESSENYQVKAEQLHICARRISELYDKLLMARGKTGVIEKLVEKYDSVVSECEENHESIDYELFQKQNPKEYNVNWKTKMQICMGLYLWELKIYYLYSIVILTVSYLLFK